MSATVSANGRVFFIVDESPLASIRFLGKWSLVARDAFNGTLLWKRPIKQWNDHLRHFRSGPTHLPRRLVAVGDTVYVTEGLAGPVLAIDGATGETIRQYEGTERTEEILVDNGVLYLVVGTSERNRRGGGLFERNEPKPTDFRFITAIETLGVGTRIALPVSLPPNSGSALATALAAPVEVITIFIGALRPRRSALCMLSTKF